jgi:hypothetical protein
MKMMADTSRLLQPCLVAFRKVIRALRAQKKPAASLVMTGMGGG